jgi:hypothetical protein
MAGRKPNTVVVGRFDFAMLAFHRDYPDAIAMGQRTVAQLPASARVPQPVALFSDSLLWSEPWAHHVHARQGNAVSNSPGIDKPISISTYELTRALSAGPADGRGNRRGSLRGGQGTMKLPPATTVKDYLTVRTEWTRQMERRVERCGDTP